MHLNSQVKLCAGTVSSDFFDDTERCHFSVLVHYFFNITALQDSQVSGQSCDTFIEAATSIKEVKTSPASSLSHENAQYLKIEECHTDRNYYAIRSINL